jgi:stage V sporulation protein AD
VPRLGRQTWEFHSQPRVLSAATVAGPVESQGPLGAYYDIRHTDDRLRCDTWEHAEQLMFDQAARIVLEKCGLGANEIDLMIGADLTAQLTSFYMGLKSLSIPSLGVYSACASICEALAVGCLAIDSKVANRVLVGTSSHYCTAERQFRYPTEYGVQKPPSSQRTVTGAGVAVLGERGSIAITEATIGEVIDMGIKNPWEMGAAMAPAAAQTISQHLKDTGRTFADYDCVVTGDLGRIGHNILNELLAQNGIHSHHNLMDCGMLIYREDQSEVFSGGSGGACATLVTFGYLFHQLTSGKWKRILLSATGALLSCSSAQQQDPIPAVSHAIVFERKDDL